jgi:hypothetical protein
MPCLAHCSRSCTNGLKGLQQPPPLPSSSHLYSSGSYLALQAGSTSRFTSDSHTCTHQQQQQQQHDHKSGNFCSHAMHVGKKGSHHEVGSKLPGAMTNALPSLSAAARCVQARRDDLRLQPRLHRLPTCPSSCVIFNLSAGGTTCQRPSMNFSVCRTTAAAHHSKNELMGS